MVDEIQFRFQQDLTIREAGSESAARSLESLVGGDVLFDKRKQASEMAAADDLSPKVGQQKTLVQALWKSFQREGDKYFLISRENKDGKLFLSEEQFNQINDSLQILQKEFSKRTLNTGLAGLDSFTSNEELAIAKAFYSLVEKGLMSEKDFRANEDYFAFMVTGIKFIHESQNPKPSPSGESDSQRLDSITSSLEEFFAGREEISLHSQAKGFKGSPVVILLPDVHRSGGSKIDPEVYKQHTYQAQIINHLQSEGLLTDVFQEGPTNTKIKAGPGFPKDFDFQEDDTINGAKIFKRALSNELGKELILESHESFEMFIEHVAMYTFATEFLRAASTTSDESHYNDTLRRHLHTLAFTIRAKAFNSEIDESELIKDFNERVKTIGLSAGLLEDEFQTVSSKDIQGVLIPDFKKLKSMDRLRSMEPYLRRLQDSYAHWRSKALMERLADLPDGIYVQVVGSGHIAEMFDHNFQLEKPASLFVLNSNKNLSRINQALKELSSEDQLVQSRLDRMHLSSRLALSIAKRI